MSGYADDGSDWLEGLAATPEPDHDPEPAAGAEEPASSGEAAAAAQLAAATAPEPDSDDDQPPLYYRSTAHWVTEWLSPTYRREVSEVPSTQLFWCPLWYEHAEAASRLGGLWRAWEHHRTDGSTGMLTWWQHADTTMAALMHPNGPFKYCSVAKGHNSTGGHVPLPLARDTPQTFITPSTPPTKRGKTYARELFRRITWH